MKKLLFGIFFVCSLSVSAQESFPYKRPELLLGKTVTIKKNPFEGLTGKYQEFYAEKSIMKPYKKERFLEKEIMEGRKFKVTGFERLHGEYKEGFSWVQLEDIATGEKLYYRYSDGNLMNYYFDVEGGLDLPADFYCDYIDFESASSYGKTISHNTTVSYMKLIKEIASTTGKTTYKLQINANDARIPKKKTGLLINFEGGKSINLPNQMFNIQTEKYFTELTLNNDQVKLFKNHKVTGYRIMELDYTFEPHNSMMLQGLMNCLIAKN